MTQLISDSTFCVPVLQEDMAELVSSLQSDVDCIARLQTYVGVGNIAWRPLFQRLKKRDLVAADMGLLVDSLEVYDVPVSKKEELVEEIADRMQSDRSLGVQEHVAATMLAHAIQKSLHSPKFDLAKEIEAELDKETGDEHAWSLTAALNEGQGNADVAKWRTHTHASLLDSLFEVIQFI